MKENIELLRKVADWLETPDIRLITGHLPEQWNWHLRLRNIAQEMENTENLLDIPENLKRRGL
jgi:hypothetical protein